ncbi:MAG: hypothetical protein IJV82_02320 [Oscillospiraceae bacterium]|nr:hypothetical protein [Oscillospiraceae bacterium]
MRFKAFFQKLSRKRLSTGALVYYSIYLILIIVFFVGMTFATVALRNWLVNFEASQPEHKAEQVFSQHFANPDWEGLYEEYGPIRGYEFMDAKDYASYMDRTLDNSRIVKYKTSAGLSGGEKYVIRAILEDGRYFNFATYTLKDLNKGTDATANWQLAEIKLMVWGSQPPERPVEPTTPTEPSEPPTEPSVPPVEPPQEPVLYHCTVLADPAHTVTVNGIPLDESHIIRSVTTKAEDYLPQGLHGYRLVELYIDGLTEAPEAVLTDKSGNVIPMVYDEVTSTYTQDLSPTPMGDGEQTAILSAATTYCKYMINAATKTELKQYFDTNQQIYATITGNDTWMQSYSSYDFADNQQVSDYYRYSDTLFSARVTLTLNVTRKDGSVKIYELDTTFFMERQGEGWKAVQMTNVDVQAQTALVRLNYMQDDELLLSELVDADANRITPPAVTGGQGEVFLGWFTKTTAENGDITMNLKFRPNDSGSVILPADYTLEPMTLYALFQAEEG